MDNHSSLFCLYNGDEEEKKFYHFDFRSRQVFFFIQRHPTWEMAMPLRLEALCHRDDSLKNDMCKRYFLEASIKSRDNLSNFVLQAST
jgi:hypothetical protein